MPTNNPKPNMPLKPVPTRKVATPAAPILIPAQAQSLHPKVIAAKINALPHPHKWMAWVGLALILVVLVGGGFYFWSKNPAVPILPNVSIPSSRSGTLTYRSSTLPSGSVTYTGTAMRLELDSLANPYPEGGYTYSLSLVKVEDGRVASSVNLQEFALDEDGTMRDSQGTEITEFEVSDVSEYNKVNLVLNLNNQPGTNPPVILKGDMPAKGQSAGLTSPATLSSLTGNVSINYLEDSNEFKLQLNGSGFQNLDTWGFRYQIWLADMSGPYVENLKSAGIMAVGSSGSARHEFVTSTDLSEVDSVIISLEPVGDPNADISFIRIASADLQ